MQLRFHIYIAFALLLFCSGGNAYAQTATIRPSIDTDIWELRSNAIPEFRSHYDDYLQYAPVALLVGMKVGGYESRTKWGRMLVSDAFSAAFMAGAVNGVKYTVGRLRPDGSSYNSFPSGHTATAFLTAALLDMEYGWRSPWFSIGGYTAAAVTGVSRIMNNKHWVSDVVAGAAIGIGSVHLGYYLADLIFKEKQLYDGYEKPTFYYDASQKHYVAELMFGRRFILGSAGLKDDGTIPVRGGLAGLSTDIALAPGVGLTALASASSLTYAAGNVDCMYSTLAGGFYNFPFAKVLELQAKVMLGYAWLRSGTEPGPATGFGERASGVDLGAGLGLSLIIDSNFKLKAFADLESVRLNGGQPWLNTLAIGFSSAWFW